MRLLIPDLLLRRYYYILILWSIPLLTIVVHLLTLFAKYDCVVLKISCFVYIIKNYFLFNNYLFLIICFMSSCYRTMQSAIWLIFFEFLIFCNLFSKYEKWGKYSLILYDKQSENYFIVTLSLYFVIWWLYKNSNIVRAWKNFNEVTICYQQFVYFIYCTPP